MGRLTLGFKKRPPPPAHHDVVADVVGNVVGVIIFVEVAFDLYEIGATSAAFV
jgi:hypothetical protein